MKIGIYLLFVFSSLSGLGNIEIECKKPPVQLKSEQIKTGTTNRQKINVIHNKRKGLYYIKIPFYKKDEVKKLEGA